MKVNNIPTILSETMAVTTKIMITENQNFVVRTAPKALRVVFKRCDASIFNLLEKFPSIEIWLSSASVVEN